MTEVKKKGSKPREFKFASDMGKLEVPEGYVGRWCSKEEKNLMKKEAEGWEYVNKTNCPSAIRREELGLGSQVKDGSNMGGALQYREMVAMMLPEDLAESRREQIKHKTEMNTKAKILASDAKRALGQHSDKFKPSIQID
jgi:hypothetical protein